MTPGPCTAVSPARNLADSQFFRRQLEGPLRGRMPFSKFVNLVVKRLDGSAADQKPASAINVFAFRPGHRVSDDLLGPDRQAQHRAQDAAQHKQRSPTRSGGPFSAFVNWFGFRSIIFFIVLPAPCLCAASGHLLRAADINIGCVRASAPPCADTAASASASFCGSESGCPRRICKLSFLFKHKFRFWSTVIFAPLNPGSFGSSASSAYASGSQAALMGLPSAMSSGMTLRATCSSGRCGSGLVGAIRYGIAFAVQQPELPFAEYSNARLPLRDGQNQQVRAVEPTARHGQ